MFTNVCAMRVPGARLLEWPFRFGEEEDAVQLKRVPMTLDVRARFVFWLLHWVLRNGVFVRKGEGMTVTT